MLKHCRRTFKEGKKESPCLNYHIKRCMGLCRGEISREEYMNSVNQVMSILDGKATNILSDLENQMKEASEKQEYEKAASIRDKMYSIENLIQKQKIDMI